MINMQDLTPRDKMYLFRDTNYSLFVLSMLILQSFKQEVWSVLTQPVTLDDPVHSMMWDIRTTQRF